MGRPLPAGDRPCSPANNARRFREWWWTVDRPLLGAILALMLAGVILSLAASPPVATRIGLDPFHFFNRHVLFLLPSFMVLIGVSFLSPRQIRRTALIVFAVSIALIVATLLFGPGGQGLAALDHAARRQHPGLRIRQARLRRDRGLAVRGIDASVRKCRRPRWRWCCC